MHNSLSQVDPADLTIHPLRKRVRSSWSKTDARYKALKVEMMGRIERGLPAVKHPIVVDAQNHILDGVDVWQAAKELQLKLVPVEITKEDPATVIVMGLALRKHYSKGALAYVVYPLLKPAHEAAQRRKLEVLKKGSAPSSPQDTTGKIEDFCDFLGFGRKLFFQAKEAHELFEKSDRVVAEYVAKGSSEKPPLDLRVYWEPQLLNGDVGLGNMIAGIAGQTSTRGQERPDHGQLFLFDRWLDESQVRFEKWSKLKEDEKRMVGQKIRELVKAMPEDLRAQWKKALKGTDNED